MKNRKLNITPVEVREISMDPIRIISKHPDPEGEYISICSVSVQDRYNKDIEQIYNAKLIVDAFNTANKCDIIPSEILMQRDNVLKYLIESTSVLDSVLSLFGNNMASTTKFGVVSQVKHNKKIIDISKQ